jgi:hypothetical protein
MALVALASQASASEGSRTRQAPLGTFGGEIAAAADKPGFFGSMILTYAHITGVTDDTGNDATSATAPLGKNPIPSVIPLPTGAPSKGAVPDGTYKLTGIGPVNLLNNQKVATFVGGYMTEETFAGGHLVFALQGSYQQQDRTLDVPLTFGVTPTPPAPLAPLVNAVAAQAQAQVTAQLAAKLATQNMSITGFGDTELSALWVRHQDRLKIAAGVSVFAPTGNYDANRGTNIGFGNFYSVRPGVAVTYSLNPNHTSEDWDRGITVAGRVSYMINGTNSDTDYRTGNLLYTEAAIVKVMPGARLAFGTNIFHTHQMTDDSGSGLGTNPLVRYQVSGIGPFLSFKLPDQNAGFNLNYTKNFAAHNAQYGSYLQLRFVKDF